MTVSAINSFKDTGCTYLTRFNLILHCLFLKNNPYQTLNTSRLVDFSSVSLELKKPDGALIKIQGLSEYLTIAVPREVSENVNDSVSIYRNVRKVCDVNLNSDN